VPGKSFLAAPEGFEMKKLLTSVAALSFVAIAVRSNGQGTVNFNSSTSPTFCIAWNLVTGVTARITPSEYTFGLYFASSAAGLSDSSLAPVLTIAGAGFPGSISGNSSLAIPGIASGTFFFEVKGWTTTGGPTYSSAVAAAAAETAGPISIFVGSSAIGRVTLGHDSVPPGIIFGPNNGTTVSSPILFSIYPEPSTMALGGLGVAALAFFRRIK